MDAVVSVLLQKLFDILSNEAYQVLEFDNQSKTLKDELLFMPSYLKDVDMVRTKDQMETLKKISSELRELLYDADDIIVDCELFLNQQRRRRVFKYVSYCSPSFLKFRYQMGRRLQEINNKIKNHRERMPAYLSRFPNQEHLRSNRPSRYTILMNDDEIVGLDNDAEKIKQWVLEAYGPLSLIGIVGMGGIGKTTLAQKVIHDNSVNGHFDHTFFVTVSQTFELKEIIKNILRKLNVNEDALRKDEYEIFAELRQRLMKKKYLVILDDVWTINEDLWWDGMKSALPGNNNGSCVIVTTRNKEVAQSMGATEMRIHYPQIFSHKDSWSLFAKIAFETEEGQCTNPDLEDIGKEIVAKCRGLPLAIKVVGGMMKQKERSVHKWRQIFENLKEELGRNKNDEPLISTLKLSYEELPTHLKPCILCFSVFPEDSEIYCTDMVEWWIGEGFVQGNNVKTAFEIGEECFDELISRCLLLGEDKDNFERRFVSCKVHDMVRDMIIKIAKEEHFMGLDDSGSPSRRLSRVGCITGMDLYNKHNLRTLVGIQIEESKEEFALNLVGQKSCQLKWLRVLNIAFKERLLLDRLPDNIRGVNWLSRIGSLQHLTCLRIENSELLDRLPNSIGSLLNLKILILWQCPKLKRLPVQITSLEKLTILSINLCNSLECLPIGIGNLSHLEELRGFVLPNSGVKDGACLFELKKLTQLRRLHMQIKAENQIEEGELHVLSELKKLEILSMRFNEKEQLLRKVDYVLQPIQQLQELYLEYYPGKRTPVWLNPTSLPKLRFLSIFRGKITCMSTLFFGKREKNSVWKLEGLDLDGLEELEEKWSKMHRAMPSLSLLKVYNCPKLKSLPPSIANNYGRSAWRKEEREKRRDIGTSEEAIND